MASCTKVFETRCRLKERKKGRKRKNRLINYGTTPSQAVFFGDAPAASETKRPADKAQAARVGA